MSKKTSQNLDQPLLAISIVSYNTAKLTHQTLVSVAADLRRSPQLLAAHELIVVDNNSSDDSVALLKKFKKNNPDISTQLILNTKNTGFATANNQAIKQSTAQSVLLLNSDTLVQAGTLERLAYALFSHAINDRTASLSSTQLPFDRIGIIAATLLNWDGTHQPQGGDMPSLLSLCAHQFMLDDIPLFGQFFPSTQATGRRAVSISLNDTHPDQAHQHPQEAPSLISRGWVGGTALLVRREVFDEIGLLDENIFMYGEDIEFCMRARNKHWDIAQHPGARVTHFQNASSSSKNALIGEIKGYLYIWSKHKPIWQYRHVKAILSLGCMLRIALFSILGNTSKVQSYQEALAFIRTQ